tara:strand:- start:1774 stop:2949 length:1176 start_codon:yes stop_codon:yes gene_type:complete
MNKDKLQQAIIQNIFERPGRLSFLFGSGCSVCAGYPMMPALTKSVVERLNDEEREMILRIREMQGGSRNDLMTPTKLHIESHLSELVDIASILQRRNTLESHNPYLLNGIGKAEPISISHDAATQLINNIKSLICEELDKKPTTLKHHTNFVRSVHQAIRDGKHEGRGPIDYYSLNYDPLLEHALALCSISYCDGMMGGRTGHWAPETLEDGHRISPQARLFKLHGSIDWKNNKDTRLPLRLSDKFTSEECGISLTEEVLIHPASTKYKETQDDPFAYMFKRFRENLSRRGPHTVYIMGYSFGDEHVNRILSDAITYSNSSDLFFIIFSGDDALPAPLLAWSQSPHIQQRVLIINKSQVYSKDEEINCPYDNTLYKFEEISELLFSGALTT